MCGPELRLHNGSIGFARGIHGHNPQVVNPRESKSDAIARVTGSKGAAEAPSVLAHFPRICKGQISVKNLSEDATWQYETAVAPIEAASLALLGGFHLLLRTA